MTQLLHDKKSIFQVLAGIIANPDILDNTREYRLSVDDFPETFHKILYGSIYNLHLQGIEKITLFEIDNAISEFPNQYRIYNEGKGQEYLEKIEELGQPENFDIHYTRVKKYSFLRSCINKGIDVSDIYDQTTIEIQETEQQQENFNRMSLEEMVRHVESKMIAIKDEFLFDNENKGSHMAENLREIVAEKLERPTYGAGFSSGLYTAATRGAIPRKVLMNSAPSGVGKSRFSISSMLAICVPEIWDEKEQKWVLTGATGRCLYVGTELEEDEVKIPALCYIANVPEDKIQNATMTEAEKARIMKAIEIMEATPFWFEQLHDFDLNDIEHVIVKNINKNNVQYIAYDYIHTSMKILTSMSKLRLQEHQVLLQMSIRLKELANKHNVFLLTATQLNGSYKEGEMDDTSLSGAKAIAQKIDIGSVMLPVNAKDEDIIDAVMGGKGGGDGIFGVRPNVSINIYKNRGNKWKLMRLWLNFNLSTLRITDCFVTDYRGNPVSELKPLHIVFEEMEDAGSDELPQAFQDFVAGEDEDMLPDAFNEPELTHFDF